MTLDQLYAIDAYDRKLLAKRARLENKSSTVIDAEYQEVDVSAAGDVKLIEYKKEE